MAIAIGITLLAGIVISIPVSGFSMIYVPYIVIALFITAVGINIPQVKGLFFGRNARQAVIRLFIYFIAVIALLAVFILPTKASDGLKYEYYKMQALKSMGDDKSSDARAFFDKALAIYKDDYVVYQNLGVLNAKNKEWQDSENNFRKALQYKPFDYMIYSNLGLMHLQNSRWDDAINNLKYSIYLNPYYAPSYMLLGTSYAAKNDFINAIYYLKLAIKTEPDLYQSHLLLADYLFELKQYNKAAEEYQVLTFMAVSDQVRKHAEDTLVKIKTATAGGVGTDGGGGSK